MKEEELQKEAEREYKELQKKRAHHGLEKLDIESIRQADDTKRNPFSYLLVLILLLLIIMMVVPFYGIKLDPEPKNIPAYLDVLPGQLDKLAKSMPGFTSESRSNYLKLLVPDNQEIRNMAARISTKSCSQSDVCYSKALYYFVRDNIQYLGDPRTGHLESPFETLYTKGADCDGMSILLANLELAVGIPVRFAFIPNHAYIQVKIDDASNKYKQQDGWISLDPTCGNCEFGEVPYSTTNKEKEYLYT